MTPGLYVILLQSILFTLLIHSGACDDNFTACGDDRPEVLQVPGPLQYPSYPNGTYMPGLFCSWMLDAGEGRASTLDFSYFDLETVFPCVYANLTIYDAETEDKSMMIGQYCGTDTIPTIMSSHRYLLVVFKTDSGAGAEGMGFSAHFDIEEVEEPACYNPGSKDISYPIGGFSSPQWPGLYPKSSSCQWILTAHQEYRLEYRDWGGVGSKTSMMECQNDYVKVTDVGTTETKELGVYCGPVPPDPHGLLGDALKFEFSSNTGTTDKGFRTTYTAVNNTDWACGGSNPAILDWSPGYITSSSNVGSICRWRLRARRGKLIYLQLKSFLIPPTTNCAQASLKIYDGEFATARLIGVYCGDKQPEYIAFSSEFAFLEFQSNIPDAMFQMTYEFYDATAKACVGSVENKPMELNNSRGIITSPYLGQTSYPSNANCQWRIKGKLGEVIRYSFNYIDIEYCPSCNCDYIYIYNSDQPESGDIISKYCGSERAPSVLTSQPNAYITFHSDATETRGGGFELDYSVVTLSDLACADKRPVLLSYEPGHIFSPYDEDFEQFPPGQQCEWLVASTTKKGVQLDFSFFDMEDDYYCRFDYVRVYDGDSNNSAIIDTFCGRNIPHTVVSSGRHMLIEFHSNDYMDGSKGFHAQFKFVEVPESAGNPNVVIIICSVAGAVAMVLLIGVVCRITKPHKHVAAFFGTHGNNNDNNDSDTDEENNIPLQPMHAQHHSVHVGGPPILSPPPYSEHDQDLPPPSYEPPAYHEIMDPEYVENMLNNDVTNQPNLEGVDPCPPYQMNTEALARYPYQSGNRNSQNLPAIHSQNQPLTQRQTILSRLNQYQAPRFSQNQPSVHSHNQPSRHSQNLSQMDMPELDNSSGNRNSQPSPGLVLSPQALAYRQPEPRVSAISRDSNQERPYIMTPNRVSRVSSNSVQSGFEPGVVDNPAYSVLGLPDIGFSLVSQTGSNVGRISRPPSSMYSTQNPSGRPPSTHSAVQRPASTPSQSDMGPQPLLSISSDAERERRPESVEDRDRRASNARESSPVSAETRTDSTNRPSPSQRPPSSQRLPSSERPPSQRPPPSEAPPPSERPPPNQDILEKARRVQNVLTRQKHQPNILKEELSNSKSDSKSDLNFQSGEVIPKSKEGDRKGREEEGGEEKERGNENLGYIEEAGNSEV